MSGASLSCPVCRAATKRKATPYRDDGARRPTVPLLAHRYEGDVVVQRCAECDGLWLTEGQLEAIRDLRENDYAHVGVMDVVRRHRHAEPVVDTPPPCPACDEEMVRSTYKDTPIHYDICMRCGGKWILEQSLRDIEAHWESFVR